MPEVCKNNSTNLFQYLQSNNIVFFICTAVLAQQVLLICDTVITSIIFPIVNKIFFNNKLHKEHFLAHSTTQDKNTSNDIYISILDIHFNITKITFTIIRLFIIIITLNLLYKHYT